MRRVLGGLGVIALFSTGVVGQSPATSPSFDVADVHVRPRSSNAAPNMTGGVLRVDRYDLRNATMLNMITVAYDLDPQTVVGGPNWLDRNRFDIIAKAPAATPPAALKLMLRSLLADRFKLVAHNDTRPVPGYALTVGSGKPNIKESTGQDKSGCTIATTTQPVPGATVTCRGVTMDAFGEALRNYAGAYVGSRVVDLTGLKGTWDLELHWTARGALAQAGPDGFSLFAAVEKQLGMKLDLQRVPTPVLVVDSVNDKPTDNPSGIAQNLPAPPPAEFDVADIKLSPTDGPTSARLQPGGRIDLQGATMRLMFAVAWEISDDELLAGAPQWFTSTKYNLVARASTSISGSADNLQIDIDDLRLMLRALITERFKLVTHMEDRPVSAYTLVADKPKLQPADPANRTNWINGPAPGARDPRDSNPMLNRFITCQNMTMAQFAEDLTRMAGGYIRVPVVDATGLDGAYDFTLSFSGINLVQGPGRGGDASAGVAAGASDPTGALSLFDALQRQLGLKLELRKRSMPVLVIDHIEEKPTEN